MPGAKLKLMETVEMFRALSDPTRVRILRLLAEHGELYQKRVVLEVGADQPSVSRHLGHLKRVGLVTERRLGRYVYLRLGRLSQGAVELLERLMNRAPDPHACEPEFESKPRSARSHG